MGLFSMLTQWGIARRWKQRRQADAIARQLSAPPLSPRRLEPRRVLDASAAGMMLSPLGDMGEFVQVGSSDPSSTDIPAVASATDPSLSPLVTASVPPSNLQILPLGDVFENDFAKLRLGFEDPLDPNEPLSQDIHTVEIDWGDGSSLESITLDAGTRFLETSHQYLDDNPTATSEDLNTVQVKVIDSTGGETTACAPITVKNVAPTIDSVLQDQRIKAVGDNFVLGVEFSDPGTLDTHTYEVDWGDGNVSTGAIAGRNFAPNHVYANEGTYQVTIRVFDDDMGMGMEQIETIVEAPGPTNVQILPLDLPLDMIDENGIARLRMTFDNSSPLDTHTVEIDWGEGTPEVIQLEAGIRSLETTHQYLDDDPTATSQDEYDPVTVTVTNNRGQQDSDETKILVKNVAPKIKPESEVTINKQGLARLRLTFDDIGSQDIHQVKVDWGDGSPVEMFTLSVGSRSLETTHQYLDGNLILPPPDPMPSPAGSMPPEVGVEIVVTLMDDDMGSDSKSVTLSNPGDGRRRRPVIVYTTPRVPRLVFEHRAEMVGFVKLPTIVHESLSGSEARSTTGETKAVSDRHLLLYAIDPEGNVGEQQKLKFEILDDLPGLFRTLPDNHYKIDLIHEETGLRRPVLDVYVREGKMIDPGDDTEGTRDRPPTDDSLLEPKENLGDPKPLEEPAFDFDVPTNQSSFHRPDDEATGNQRWVERSDRVADAVQPTWHPSTRIDADLQEAVLPHQPDRSDQHALILPVAAGLVSASSFRSWAHQVDRTVASAGAQKWSRLRWRCFHNRKNRGSD